MKLAVKLDVHTPETPTMLEARSKWSERIAAEPVLDVVNDLLELPAWTRQGHPARDDLVRALVKLGSPRLLGVATEPMLEANEDDLAPQKPSTKSAGSIVVQVGTKNGPARVQTGYPHSAAEDTAFRRADVGGRP